MAVVCVLFAPLGSGVRAQDVAKVLSVRVGETVEVPLAGVDSVLCIEEHAAQVAVTAGGFAVLGRAYGDTVLQVLTATAMHVYVVHVLAPPPRPPGPAPAPNIRDRGAITGFWGDNHYQISYFDSTLAGSRFAHLLAFHGRAGKGEYQANAQVITGALGDHLQYAKVAWQNDAKDLAFELGDTAGRLFGSSLAGAMPFRGMRSSLSRKFGGDRGEWAGEIFAGEARGPADPYATSLRQPVAGTSLSGAYAPISVPELRLSFGSSLLAFSTDGLSGTAPGDSGVLAGMVGRGVYKHVTLELRSALSASAPHVDEAKVRTTPSFGAKVQHQDSDGGVRLEYEHNRPGMVVPQNGSAMPGTQRLSGSFDRRARGAAFSASVGYSQVTTLPGQSGGGLSYRLGTQLHLRRKTRLSVAGGQSSMTLPSGSLNGQQPLRKWSKLFVTSRLNHPLVAGLWNVQSELTFSRSKSADSTSNGVNGALAVLKRRAAGGKWDGSGVVTVAATRAEARESVLAIDQPPLYVTTSAVGQARFVQGPFESFGGLGLQLNTSPTFQAGPTINLGFQFTPTAAHQITASYSGSRWMQTGRWNQSVSATYTYHFGDAVRAAPLFEFMSYGVVEGRICYDEDSDGSCAPDEPPIGGIPLVLSNGMRAASSADGSYRFERVKPGFYHLDVDEAVVRERGRPTTLLTVAFDLPARGDARKSFAVARACRIRGHVVHDLDMNGRIEDDEPLFGGPLVVATGEAGTFQTHVNHNGTFAMTVPCGEYGMEIDPASLPSMHSPGDDGEIRVTTSANDTPAVKLLVRSIRTISGTVFIDRNRNGQRDADEPVVPGALVRFGEAFGPTDESGAFLLRRLPAGSGQLVVDPVSLPAGLRPGDPSARTLPKQAAAIENVHLPVWPAP